MNDKFTMKEANRRRVYSLRSGMKTAGLVVLLVLFWGFLGALAAWQV